MMTSCLISNAYAIVGLNDPIQMTATMLIELGCLEVMWNKINSGACYVRFDLVLKTGSGASVFKRTGHNIYKVRICDMQAVIKVANVQLIVSFRNAVRYVSLNVSQEPTTIQPQTPAGMISCFRLFRWTLYCEINISET